MTYFDLISENDESTVVAEFDNAYTIGERSYMSEKKLEDQFIYQLEQQQYEFVPITTEAELISNLRKQIEKLNKVTFNDGEWKRFFNGNIAKPNTGIVEKTRIIQEDPRFTFTFDDGKMANIMLLNKTHIHENNLQVMRQYKTASPPALPNREGAPASRGRARSCTEDCCGSVLRYSTPSPWMISASPRPRSGKLWRAASMSSSRCSTYVRVLNRGAMKEKSNLNIVDAMERAQEFLLQCSGVKDVYTAQRLTLGAWTPGISQMRNGFNPKCSGDIFIQVAPGWELRNEDLQTSQQIRVSYVGFPIIFMGYDIEAKTEYAPTSVDVIAPTLAHYMRIRAPNACSTRPLNDIRR